MYQLLDAEKYSFVTNKDKEFITGIDSALKELGYENEGIKPYVCWGKYMIAYSKAGRKTKNYVCRFYFRDDCVIFRLYFKNIDDHRNYIENAPDFMKAAFINDVGKCQHCDNNCKDAEDNCSHRKTYTIDGIVYEKCDGQVFLFFDHELENIPKYIELFQEFYPKKK